MNQILDYYITLAVLFWNLPQMKEYTEMRKTDEVQYRQYLDSIREKTLIPPEIRYAPPARYQPQVDDYTMSSGMAMTHGGTLWLAWFGGGDDERAVMLLARSRDEGKTFSPALFVIDPGFVDFIHMSVVVGNLWTAPDGRLFWFFTMGLGHFDGRGGSWFTVCENPDDEVPVWSKPVRIWHGATLNKPTVLTNGTWMLPVALWPNGEGKCRVEAEYPRLAGLCPELDPERKAWYFASVDQGKTWQRRAGVVLPPDLRTFDEHMIVEREDGSLLMYLRTVQGMAWSESYDEGFTWKEPETLPFCTANARFFLTKLSSGNLLLVRHDSNAREKLTAYISDNQGKSWKGGLLLDERLEISYPDGFQHEDGRIFIQYDRKREGGELLLSVFTEEDVLAGKDVSGKLILKHPMIQSKSILYEMQ